MKLFIFSLICFRKTNEGTVYRAAPFYAFTDSEDAARDAATEWHMDNNPPDEGFFDHDVAIMEVPLQAIRRNVGA